MRLRPLLERHIVEALAAALAALGVVEALAGLAEAPEATVVGVALLTTLPLLFRRRFPLVAPAFVFAALAALSVARPDAVTEAGTTAFGAFLLAFWIVGVHLERHQAVAGAAVGLAALAVLARGAEAPPSEDDPLLPGGAVDIGTVSFDIVFLLLLAAGIWLVAFSLQHRARRASVLEERAARLEREREERARAAVAEERRRIARDLHDVIAHSVTVMTVQAGAARLLLSDEPERARAPLNLVEETGREALAEMRRLLGILRDEDGDAARAPQPGLAQLEQLLAHARQGGLPVELTIEGEPRALQTGVDLAAYRIVQEAITNARKHAGPARAHVLVRYEREALELEIANDGRHATPGDDSGHGLVGLRERIALYGGELEAGPRPGGGFSVRARLPLEVEEPPLASASRPKRWPHERAPRPESQAVGDERGLRARLRDHGFDALVIGLAAVSEFEIWVTSVPGPKVVLVPAVLLWTLPLLWRQRFPFAAPAFAFAIQALSAFAGDEVGSGPTSFAAFLLTFWAFGAHNGRRQALAGAAIGFASIAVITDRDMRVDPADMMSVVVTGGVLTVVAYALQRRASHTSALEERAARLERERDERARAAVAQERRRIARDLHDVIAHSVSVMTVQAGAARLLLADEPERARAPLTSVEETGRQALAEIRRLLGIIRMDEPEAPLAPRPGLAALTGLLTQVRTAGLPVELAVEGEERSLPSGLDLAAYRIVQEALTNARKHAGPARAHVLVRYRREALELEITNDGHYATRGDGGGHGLIGMRERVALYGGELEAGLRSEGVYAVRARLPVEPAQP